jgi:AbrB family looped-hinge helix DNA binding protein
MKEYLSSVSPKGQITIPIEIRRHLGVRPKDKVVITLDGDEVKIALATSRRYKESFQAVPALQEPRTIEEMIAIAQEDHALEVAKEGLGE